MKRLLPFIPILAMLASCLDQGPNPARHPVLLLRVLQASASFDSLALRVDLDGQLKLSRKIAVNSSTSLDLSVPYGAQVRIRAQALAGRDTVQKADTSFHMPELEEATVQVTLRDVQASSSTLQSSAVVSSAMQSSVATSSGFTSSAVTSSTGLSSSAGASSHALSSSSSLPASSGGLRSSTGTMVDARDGASYPTVVIWQQNWMAKNLGYSTASGSWCYGNSDMNCSASGRMYDQPTALTACPAGWHLPSKDELMDLVLAVGDTSVAGRQLKAIDAAWSPNTGVDAYGFAALPGGVYNGNFASGSLISVLWSTSTNSIIGTSWALMVWSTDDKATLGLYYPTNGLSVRCVQGTPINRGQMTDTRDGQVYRTSVIGSQTWLAQNLNYSGDNGAGARTYMKGWCPGVGGTDTTRHQDSSTCAKGRLYSWTDAMGFTPAYQSALAQTMITSPHQGICPVGWHVPTFAEYDTLMAWVRADQHVPLNKEGAYLKGVATLDPRSWNSPFHSAHDPYGFSALPMTVRNFDGFWEDLSQGVVLWSASEIDAIDADYLYLIDLDDGYYEYFAEKTSGYPVRCVMN